MRDGLKSILGEDGARSVMEGAFVSLDSDSIDYTKLTAEQLVSAMHGLRVASAMCMADLQALTEFSNSVAAEMSRRCAPPPPATLICCDCRKIVVRTSGTQKRCEACRLLKVQERDRIRKAAQ